MMLTDGQKPTPKPKKAGPPGGPIKKRSFSDGEDKGILMTMFDGSVSFLENLRRQYKFGFSKDDRRRVSRVWFAITADIGTNTRVKRGADETEMKTNVDTAMDTDPDDKTLQVVGDGSVYMMVWKNKSYDGGRSYELIAEYQRHEETKMKNDFEGICDNCFNKKTPYKPEKTETKPSKPDPQPDDQSSDDTKSDDKPKPSPTTESKPESTTEEDFAPDPHELVNTTPPPIVDYPTDRDKNYPSNKDGTYGFVVQLTYGPNPELIRLRGKEMYYFNKVGNNIVFTNDMMPVKNNRMKLPPDITSAFREELSIAVMVALKQVQHLVGHREGGGHSRRQLLGALVVLDVPSFAGKYVANC
ncbi:unnamed protein product [Medioppia subpectinata]|uniref:Uncharacterized protein n=1 Tax=Medioppia subpectinata TaxID=1979941 RepID=A0A7R9KBF5_9ACAR|nr:unnamed protein product [Medioppia subpectinata]CAG2100324.1 unnamed protein product [Medioppia subpectinata]